MLCHHVEWSEALLICEVGAACRMRGRWPSRCKSLLTGCIERSEKGYRYGYMPPKGPQTLVETILLWSVKRRIETDKRRQTVTQKQVRYTAKVLVKPRIL